MKKKQKASGKELSKRQVALALFLIIAASFLIGYFTVSRFYTLSGDEPLYVFNSYLETKGSHVYIDYFNAMQKTPATVWIIAPIIYFFGNGFESVMIARILLLFMKAAATVLVYLISLQVFRNKKSALVAAGFFSFSALMIESSTVVTSMPTYVLLCGASLYFYFSDRKYGMLFAGLFCGFAVLFRQTGVVFAATLALFIILQNWRKITHYILGGVLGVAPLVLYLAFTKAFEVFLLSVFEFNKYHPLNSQSLIAKIVSIFVSFRYESYLVILLLFAFFFHRKIFSISNLKSSRQLVLYGIISVHLVYLLAIPRVVFQPYLNEIIIPICILCAEASLILLNSKDAWKRAAFYFLCCLFIMSVIMNMIFPLSPINNRDYYTYQDMKSRGPDTIMTDYPQFIYLLGKEEFFYLDKSQENAFIKSHLNEKFPNKTLEENQKEFDIIYLNSYDTLKVNLSQYDKVCVSEKAKSLIFYAGEFLNEIGVSRFVRIPRDNKHFEHCYNYYYAKKQI